MRKLNFFLLLTLVSCRGPSPRITSFKDPDYDKALSFLDHQNDSAFYFFNKVAAAAKDSLQTASAYNYMAQIQSDAGDYFGGQESLSVALKFLAPGNKKDFQCLTSTYNELGLTNIRLKNPDAAIHYFDQAGKFSQDSGFQLILLNNKALAYQDKGAYLPALKLYRDIINKRSNPETYSRILNNFATTKWLNDPNYNAAPELLKALQIRLHAHDLWGLNSSYIHLADFYFDSRPDSALYFAMKLYHSARSLHSPDDQLDALSKLIRLVPLNETKTYFRLYQQLSDSLQTARNADKNQFALIRYEAEKNKAENLRLQKDNADEHYQLLQQRTFLYGLFLAFIALVFFAVRWYRRRKQRLEQEKFAAVQETQRKASKKVHDTLANDIYLIMKQVQHAKNMDRGQLVGDINELYQRARDLSHEMDIDVGENFHEKISLLLKSFATETTRVLLVGNSETLWEKVNGVCKLELKYVLQELMVNMQKHSQAANVVLKFENERGLCQITYSDDGIGIPPGTLYQNGLKNTENRMNAIGGEIIFETGIDTGLQVRLSFPIT